MAIEASRAIAELQQLESMLSAISTKIAANENVIESVKVNGTAVEVAADKSVDITVPTTEEITATVNEAVAKADHLKRKKVASVEEIDLEAADADQYIYMVPKAAGAEGDSYDEYMVIEGKLEKVGDWKVDLTDYVTTTALNTALEPVTTKLDTVEEGATKVEATEGSGAVTINGTEVQLVRMATEAEFDAMLVRAGLKEAEETP